MAYEYVKQAYGVNPEIGARVRHNEIDKHGVIVRRKSYDNYVYVKFDGEKFAKPCHPKALDYPPVGKGISWGLNSLVTGFNTKRGIAG